jgi:IS30 family transposase
MEKTQLEIALAIGVSQSSISREIARNSKSYRYDFRFAHGKSVECRSSASKIPKKMKGALESRVLNCLHLDWSLEQISWRLKLEGICISHESIYSIFTLLLPFYISRKLT